MNKIEANKENADNIEEPFNFETILNSEGFDLQAGETWIYPTNYSLREYQYNIIQKALLNNTMVSLPTGLGKTFIAAVVMYNFYRWYPSGKIIFMAPTKPLVTQQIDACYNIMAIPKEVTTELTGSKAQNYRKEVWKEKRVFFITPQILQNDLSILNELASKIKCLVFDEAHKAKGNHAYCEVIRKIMPHNKNFRVLGLSATPGNTLTDVLEVIKNLLISHIEIRTDESPDVVPYVFQRTLETVVVPLDGKLQEVKEEYIKILEKYTRVLKNHKIITGNCSMLTKGKIFMTLKNFKENSGSNRNGAYSEIMRSLNICVTLYHAYELLIRHGLRGFLSFFEEHSEKPLLCGNMDLKYIMQDVQEYLGPAPKVVLHPDGSIEDIPETTKFGHPKFYKLRDVLSEHFTNTKSAESRVIVFCEYRESVMEAYALLLRSRPIIKPQIFLGQGAITQRQQLNVIKLFRSGECNTLISTCIGEEGLDVGDVDLIICFDISNKSPVRMIQRMGRTGRKREGRVVILVTEGKEQQTLKDCLIHKQNLSSHILQSSVLHKELYAENPRMVPDQIDPKPQKLFITVKPQEKNKKTTSSIKELFDNISKKVNTIHPEDLEIIDVEDRLPVRQEHWNKVNPLNIESNKSSLNFSKNISKLRMAQTSGRVGHSKSTNILLSVLQFADSKKFNILTTQVPVLPSQVNQTQSSNVMKQTDIRDMFFKAPTSSTQTYQIIEDESDLKTQNILKACSNIISNINLDSSLAYDCKICKNLFNCCQYSNLIIDFDIRTCTEVDYSILDCLTESNLNFFHQYLTAPKIKPLINDCDTQNKEQLPVREDIISPTVADNYNNRSVSALHLIDETMTIKDSPFKPPNNIQHMLEKCGMTSSFIDSAFNDTGFTQAALSTELTVSTPKICHKTQVLPPLNFEDFENAEFTQEKIQNFQETLSFFKMSSLNELFEEHSPKSKENLLDETLIYSPGDYEESEITVKPHTSPILTCRSQFLRSQVPKRLFNESKPASISNDSSTDLFFENSFITNGKIKPSTALVADDNLSDEDVFDESDVAFFSKNKNLETHGKIESLHNTSNIIQNGKLQHEETEKSNLKIDELIDLKAFGFVETTQQNNEKVSKKSNKNNEFICSDFCDDSFLNMFFESNVEENAANETMRCSEEKNSSIEKNNIEIITLDDTSDESFVETKKAESNSFCLTPKKSSHVMEIVSPTLTKSQYYLQSSMSQYITKTISEKSKTEEQQKPKKLSLASRLSSKINKNSVSSKKSIKISPNKNIASKNDNELSPILCSQNKLCVQPTASTSSAIEITLPVICSQNKTFIRPKVSMRVNSEDSDDDFELPSKKSYGWIKKKANPVKQIEKPVVAKKDNSLDCNRGVTRKVKKKNAKDCQYLNLEAEVSIDGSISLDSSNVEESDDAFEASFVDDETQNLANNTMMHAHYLQSVKSPVMNRGKFKIPEKRPFIANVYSQVVQETENNYVNDTFCVTSDDENLSETQNDMSMLEIAEMLLEKKKKKRRKLLSSPEQPNKKRRVMVISSSDSE